MAGVDETAIGGGDTVRGGDSVGGGISGIREGQDLAEESVCLHKSWQFKYLIMNFLNCMHSHSCCMVGGKTCRGFL